MLKAALTVGVLAFAIATAHAQDVSKTPDDITPDRYQIVLTQDVPAEAFLLDTSTGHVWHMTHMSDLKGEPDVWMYMARIDSEAAKLALYAEYGRKGASTPAIPSAKLPLTVTTKPVSSHH